jgi:hypothetical protein
MRKQKILYNKFIFSDTHIPMGKKVHITKDNKKLYYINKRVRVYVKDLDLPYNNIIKVSITTKYSQDKVIILVNLEINSNTLTKYINDPIKFVDRKKTIDMIKQCYQQYCSTYSSCIIMGLFDSALNDNDKLVIDENILKNVCKYKHRYHKKNLEWMLQREKESEKKYSLYSKPIFRVGSELMDIDNGEFISNKNIEKEPARFRGGLLVNNTDDNWMYDFINLSLSSLNITKKKKTDFFSTSATLIICSRNMCHLWKKKICDINTELRVIIIDNKLDHDKITYNDIVNTNFVIINKQYLTNKQYKKLYAEYSSINIMRQRYVKCVDVVEMYKNPIFSFFYWNRIILDSEASNELIKNNQFQEKIFTFEGYFRWLQLYSIPSSHEELMLFVKYLIKNKEVNLPLYNDNNNMVLLNDIIRINTKDTLQNHTCIKENIVKINMLDFEKKVYNFCIENSNDKENREFNSLLIDFINQLNVNWLSSDGIRSCISKIISKEMKKLSKSIKCQHNNAKRIDTLKRRLNSLDLSTTDECKICCIKSKTDNMIITHCGHYFCTDCALNIIKYSNTCPFCREDINIETLYKVKSNELNMGSKIQYVLSFFNNVDKKEKTVLVIKQAKTLVHISNTLKQKKFKNSRCFGNHLNKIKKIEKFNDSGKILLLHFNDLELLSYVRGCTKLLFYDDPYRETVMDRKKLLNMDIFSRAKNINIYHLVYKGTYESLIKLK